MQATISVQQQLTRETVEIIVCRSSLAALTSGESLCGALTELFEVSVSVFGGGVVWGVHYMLVCICAAFHDARSVTLAGGQMRVGRKVLHNSCKV